MKPGTFTNPKSIQQKQVFQNKWIGKTQKYKSGTVNAELGAKYSSNDQSLALALPLHQPPTATQKIENFIFL